MHSQDELLAAQPCILKTSFKGLKRVTFFEKETLRNRRGANAYNSLNGRPKASRARHDNTPSMSTKVLDLPLDLAFSLPPLDRFSFILQVLPTREAYLHLELVLLVEVRTQPGC